MELAELAQRLRTLKLPQLVGWQRTAAWAGLGVFLFALFLALTFPYDAVRARIASEADAVGLWVRIDAMGPAFLGVSARGVRVGERPEGLGPPETTVRVDRLTLRPSLYPWGVGFSAALFGGTAGGAIGTGNAPKLRVHFDRLSLGKAGVGALTGVDAVGTLDGELSLDIPTQRPAGRAGSVPGLRPDPAHRKRPRGEGRDPDPPPDGTDDPRRPSAGQLREARRGPADRQGRRHAEGAPARGPELDIQGTGTVRLARAVAYCEPDVTLRIRPMPDFMRRMGMIAAGFTQLPVDPADSAYRNAKLTGYLGKPNVRPGR